MIFSEPFELPAPPTDFYPDPEGCWPPLPFDLRLDWLAKTYAASIKLYVECGLLDGAHIAGEWWVERAALEYVLRDAGHSTFDKNDPAHIPANLLMSAERRRTLRKAKGEMV